MNTILTFITILAWIGAIGGTIIVILKGLAHWSYNSNDIQSQLSRLKDSQQGFRKTYPIKTPLIAAIVSWSWLITIWINN